MDTMTGAGISSDKVEASDCFFISGVSVYELWEKVKDYIEDSLEGFEQYYSPEHILQMIAAGQYQLWIVHKGGRIQAALVTRVDTYMTGARVCEMLFIGGHEMGDWLPLIQKVEAWAESLFCTHIRAVGRRGWERMLKKYGFHYEACFIGKPLIRSMQ